MPTVAGMEVRLFFSSIDVSFVNPLPCDCGDELSRHRACRIQTAISILPSLITDIGVWRSLSCALYPFKVCEAQVFSMKDGHRHHSISEVSLTSSLSILLVHLNILGGHLIETESLVTKPYAVEARLLLQFRTHPVSGVWVNRTLMELTPNFCCAIISTPLKTIIV